MHQLGNIFPSGWCSSMWSPGTIFLRYQPRFAETLVLLEGRWYKLPRLVQITGTNYPSSASLRSSAALVSASLRSSAALVSASLRCGHTGLRGSLRVPQLCVFAALRSRVHTSRWYDGSAASLVEAAVRSWSRWLRQFQVWLAGTAVVLAFRFFCASFPVAEGVYSVQSSSAVAWSFTGW